MNKERIALGLRVAKTWAHDIGNDYHLAPYLIPWLVERGFRLDNLEQGLPLMPFSATKYLEKFLKPEMSVFEWGSGGSTLFFAIRAGSIVTVEHDSSWYRKVSGKVAGLGMKNVELKFVPPEPVEPGGIALIGSDRSKGDFSTYCQFIRKYDTSKPFDIVVVDGRARNDCVKEAVPYVAPGGVIILDDSERVSYRRALQYLGGLGWKRSDFTGLKPGPVHLETQTSIFLNTKV